MENEEKIELLRISNGNNNYPGNFTKEEIEIMRINSKYPILHLFSGKSKIGTVKVDYKYGDFKMDVFDYLEQHKDRKFKTIIIDAPYNKKFADIYEKLGDTGEQFIIFANAKKTTLLFDYIDRIDPDVIILKSWNYYCLERYKIRKCYICYAGGYRKSTFLIVMERKQYQLEEHIK